jgi:hypothetical protein
MGTHIIIKSRSEGFFSFNEASVVCMSSMLVTLSETVRRIVQAAYITSQQKVVFWVGFFPVAKGFFIFSVVSLNLGGYSSNESVCYSIAVVMQGRLRTACILSARRAARGAIVSM